MFPQGNILQVVVFCLIMPGSHENHATEFFNFLTVAAVLQNLFLSIYLFNLFKIKLIISTIILNTSHML